MLYEVGVPVLWFAEPVTKQDVARFGIDVGDARHQALLEMLAILIGVRMWLDHVVAGRATVVVRCDSQAALGATANLKSRDARMNAVVRELALDVAEGRYELHILEHLPGRNNVYADALSRFYQPGASRDVPPTLMHAARTYPDKRGSTWWLASAGLGGEVCEGAGFMGDAVGEEAEEAAWCGKGMWVGEPWDVRRGGALHDVRLPDARTGLQDIASGAAFVYLRPDAGSFSTARGRPVKAATSWPRPLRSKAHPYGVTALTDPHRVGDKEKVERGNAVGIFALRHAAGRAGRGQAVAVVNPADSFLWMFREARELCQMAGITTHIYSECGFGGMSFRKMAIVTNVAELGPAMRDKACEGGAMCRFTGRPHSGKDPEDAPGEKLLYRPEVDDEPPARFCEVLAEIARTIWMSAGRKERFDVAFFEVFSGRHAHLSRRIAAQLGASGGGLCGSSSSS